MALKWNQFAGSDYYRKLPEAEQGAARRRFFDDQVAPRYSAEQREGAWADFDRRATMMPATVATPAQAPASIQRPQANVAARAAIATAAPEQAAMPQRPVRPGQVQPAASAPAIAAPAGGAGFVEGMKDFGRTAVKSVVQGIPEAAANLADYIDTPEFDASGRQISDDGALSKWARATRAAAEKRGEPWQESTFGQEARAKDDMSWRGGAGAAGESMGLSWGPGLAGAAAGAAIGSMAGGVGAIPGAAAGYAIGSLATLPLFFGAQAKDTYDRVFKQAKIDNPELDDESAHDKAVVAGGFTGLIEAAGERVSDIVGGKLFRLMPPGVKNGMVRAATKSFQGVRQMIADMLKIVGTEVGTELAQGASQSAVEASYGVGEGPTWQNQKGVIVPTIIMSLVGGGAAQGVSAAARYRTAKLLQDPARDPEQRLIAARNVAGAIHQQDPELAKLFLGEAQNLIAARKPVIAEGDQFYRDLKPLAQREEDQRMAAGKDMPSEEARTAAFGEAPADVPRGTEIPPEAFAQPEGAEAADTLATDENGDILIEDGGEPTPLPDIQLGRTDAPIAGELYNEGDTTDPVTGARVPGVAPPTEQPITDAAAVAPPQEPQAVEPAPLAAPAENGSTLQGEMVEPLNPEARKQHMNAIGANLKVLRAEREAAKKAGDEALMAEVDDEIQATAVNFKRLANNQAPLPTPREQAAGSTQNLGQDPAQNLGQVPAMPEAPALEPAAARPKNDGIDLADEQPVKALDDERMQDPDFRNWMESAVGGLVSVKDGNLGLVVDPNFIKGESDRGDEVRMIRAGSVNPPWFQEIAAAENVSVDGLRGIVKKAMTGAKLGVRQDRAVRKLMDAITDERIGELQDWGRGLGMSAEEVAGLHNDNPVAHMRALEAEVSARQKKAADAEVEQQWAEQDAVVAGKKAFTPDVVLGEDAPDVDGYDFSDQEAIEGHVYATAVGWGVPVAQLDELHAQAPDAESFLSSVRNAIREIRANEKIRSDQGEAGSVADIGGPGAPESGESAAAEAERLAALEQARAEAIPALEEYLGTDWRKDGERRARLAAASPDELVEEVYRDKMTGLLNKRAWNEDTTKAGFEKQGRRSKPYAIAYIDLDGLKFLNDQMGHSAGDELLANFGAAMKAAGIDGYHISGDEFGAIFENEADASEAMDRLQREVESSVVRGKSKDGRGITNTGIAFSYGLGGSANSADMAMQDNKKAREAQGLRTRGGMPSTAAYDEESVLQPYDQAAIDAKAAEDKARAKKDADAAAKQKADDERGDFVLAGSARPADQAAARGAQDMFSGGGEAPAAPKAKPSANTIFTEDAAEKARAVLRAKLGQVSTGIDPEIVQAGITLAGYHIEKGARSFSAYAKAMLADLGDAVRPYLKSWYVAISLDPRAAAFDGMDSYDAVKAVDVDAITSAPESDPINAAAHEAATSPQNGLPEPTDGQKEAGNYKLGHLAWNGLDISIENPAGSVRRGTDEDGKAWENTLQDHYGYLKLTTGNDGDHVDVFLSADENRADTVFIVDQMRNGGNKGAFDEHKVLLGYPDKASAVIAYKRNYAKGWGVGPVTEMTVDEFKAWLADGDQTKPVEAQAPTEPQKSKGHIAWIEPTPENPARRELVARDDGKIGIADASNAIDMATGNRFSRSQALDTPENRARLLQSLTPEAKDTPPAADEDLSSAADPLAPTGDEAFDKALRNRTIRFAMTRAKMTEKRGEYNGVPYVTRTWTASVKLRGRSERDALPGYLKVNRTLPEPVGEDTSFILSTRTGSNVGDAMNAEIQISRTEFDYQDGKSEAPAAAPTASEPKPADLLGEEQKPKTRIADFGERIEGAAKYRDRYSDQMTEAMEADIAAVPLSESWPEPDYEKMLEEGADPGIVAFVHAARDEIPVKPKKRWKVAGWTEAVRLLRDVSNGLINGSIPADKFRETLAKPEFMRVARDVGGRADLYQAVGHGVSLKGVTLRARSFSRLQPDNSWKEIRDWGVEREAKASAFGNWPQELGVGNTREEAIAAFKAKHAEMAGAEKPDAQTSFEIYRYRANPGVVVIGKKIGKDRVDLAQFPTIAEARSYLKDNHDALVAKLEAYKKIPRERRLTNEPRVGVNHRNGGNVTEEQFKETFGFRGGQFGSSLLSAQKEAQAHLNESYDALMDLAGVLGVPPKALSLNGELALAFAARGRGGVNAAAAHYERDTKGVVTDSTVVINLTRKHGAGSLAHEWFHALDNYFARARKERGGMLTEKPFPRGEGVRPEMVAAFKNLMDTIKRTALEQRSMALDKRRTKLYWSTGLEMAARSFESYTIEKLRDQGASNDYLANIVSPEYWAAEEALRDFSETGNMGEQQEQTYPYPTAAEIPAIRAAFDHFFDTIETKETDKGIAIQEGEGVYSVESRGKKYGDRASQPIDDLFGDPYENAEQRPGTTEKQRDLGRDALRDLSRRIGLDSVARRFNAGGSAPSILGAGLVRNFVAGQPNSLIGGTIQSPRDLAALAQVYRDPRFETFRIAYLKGDTVVGEAGYSSRMPGIVDMGNGFIADVSNDMKRFGADGYYAMHNHPSGSSAPSTADSTLTIELARKVSGFRGHVVIDHNEYSVLDASGWHKTHNDDKLGSADFRADPVVQSDLLGAIVAGPRDVVDLAKRVQKPDMATVVMTVAGETGRVNLVVDLPADALRSHAPRMGALIRRMARGSGSGGNRFLVLPDGYPKAAFQHLITYGVFTDVVGADGTSSVEELPSLYDVFRRRDVLTKGLKGARVYEPEALYSRGAEEEEDAISKAKQAAIAARNAFRAIDRTKKIEDADSYFDLSSKMSDAKSAFADALGQIPADQFALRGMTSDGRILLLTPSAQRPGFWQLTRFDINGEPWGDTQYPTREQATREFLDDATPESVTDHSAQFSRGDSAKGHTEAALYDRLRTLFGPKFMDRLFQTGRFRVITEQDAANILGAADTDALKSGGAVRGFYHRGNGITYLVADSIPAKFTDAQLKGLMRHEIGVHALKAGRDSAGWQNILGEIDRLIDSGDKAVHAAFLRAGAAGTRDVDLLEEVAGYLVEDAPSASIVRRILAWLKDQVYKLTGLQLKLTDADVVAMAQAALRAAPRALSARASASMVAQPAYSAPAPVWVSALKQRIAEQGAKTRTGNDWSAWLQGNAAKLGIKKDEIEWSGVTDYLAARGKDKLGTTDITDWLDANGVQVSESVLGERDRWRQRLDLLETRGFANLSYAEQDEVMRLRDRRDGENVAGIRDRLKVALEDAGYGIEFDDFDYADAEVTYLDEDGDAVDYDDLPPHIQAIVDRESQAEDFARRVDESAETKFNQYQLPGGENYRELLLTLPLPEKEVPDLAIPPVRAAQNVHGDGKWYLVDDRGEWGRVAFDTRAEAEAALVNVPTRKVPDSSRAFIGGHFDQPNILAHVRFNERADADGRRVLFIEEIQSDWAQKGRKEGFVSGQLSDQPMKAIVNTSADQPYWEVRTESGVFVANVVDISPDSSTPEQAIASAREIARTRNTQRGTPSAPFVTDTKAWTALALKRMTRYAVDNGFEAIAWTTGGQQKDRYSLAKQLSTVEVDRGHNDYFKIDAYDKSGDQVIFGKTANEDTLPNLVGKELAEKMIAAEPGRHTFSGLDLEVGGEGMHAFYDGIVPQVARDLLKKLGGTGLTTVSIDTGAGAAAYRVMVDGEHQDAETREEADRIAEMTGGTVIELGRSEQPAFAITDKMRELAGRGMAMFSRASAIDTPAFKAWFKESKVVDAHGAPLVVYHGTTGDFDTFRDRRGRSLSPLQKIAQSVGIGANQGDYFFAASPEFASTYAGQNGALAGGNVMPAYLSLQNPAVFDQATSTESLAKAMRQARAAGNDGMIVRNWSEGGLAPTDVFIAFDAGQIKSSIGNNGRFDPANPGILFSRGAAPTGTPQRPTNPVQGAIVPPAVPPVPPQQGAMGLAGGATGPGATFSMPGESLMDTVIYRLQDKLVDLKRVQQAIKAAGRQISEAYDAYQKEELFHGRAATRTKEFLEDELDPLVADMRARGVSQEDLGRYLWARHAPEVNARIATINPALPDGGSGMTNAEAAQYMAGLTPQQQADYAALAARVDAITQGTRDALVDDKLISAQDRMDLQSMYQHYVPLYREDMDTVTQGMGTGQGYSVRGAETRRRTGSALPVVDILGNIANQRDRAIIRGEKARVGRALYALALTNKNPRFWRTATTAPLVKTHDRNGMVVEVPDPMWKQRDNVVTIKVPTRRGNIVERAVIFNERDPRAARMARAIKNLDGQQLGEFLGATASVTRYFASINTQYNPIFGVVNLIRDVQTAMLNLSSTPLAGKQAAVAADMARIVAGAMKHGLRDFDGPWKAIAREFEEAGGMTGYRDMFRTGQERTEAIEKALDPNWWQKRPWGRALTADGYLKAPAELMVDKGARPVMEWLSDYNQVLENATRLAAYKQARDSGLSKDASASIAKNLTVNFNRKGEMALQLGALYAFFNAATQGIARMGQTFAGPAGKYIVGGGVLAGVLQAMLLAAAGYDDEEPPQFVRERALILPTPWNKDRYVSIPMPLGFHVLPNFGRLIVEAMRTGDLMGKTASMMGIMADAFNPLGGSAPVAQILSPTATDPFVALGMNKDWTGKPIAREDFSNLHPTPGFTRARDAAGAPARWLAKALNRLSGGTDYTQGLISPTPDQIEYLAGQLTGGIGREAIKASTTATSIVTGDELPMHKVPLIGRFYGSTEGQAPQANKFYANLKKLNEHGATVKGLRADRRNAEVMEYLRDNPDARLFEAAGKAERKVSELRARRRALAERDASKAELKRVDDLITAQMVQLNDRMKALSK